MTAEREPQSGITDSDTYVNAVLAHHFEMLENGNGLTDIAAAGFLAGIVAKSPGENVKVVSLVGGSGSGKSTMASNLTETLVRSGIKADYICTDDFLYGDRAWRWAYFEGDNPQDPLGKYGFDFMREKIEAVRQISKDGPTIVVPSYDKATGLAIDAGEENYTHRIGKLDALIVEGDFHPVENPELLVFLHVPDEQRLQNRIVRDLEGVPPEVLTINFNIRQHRQHFPHTLPVIEHANIVVCAEPGEEAWRYDIYQAKQAV